MSSSRSFHRTLSATAVRFSSHLFALQTPGRLCSCIFRCVKLDTFQWTCCSSSTTSPPYVLPLLARYVALPSILSLYQFSNGEACPTIRLFTRRLATSVAPMLADECFGAFSRMFPFVPAYHTGLLNAETACSFLFLITTLFLPQDSTHLHTTLAESALAAGTLDRTSLLNDSKCSAALTPCLRRNTCTKSGI